MYVCMYVGQQAASMRTTQLSDGWRMIRDPHKQASKQDQRQRHDTTTRMNETEEIKKGGVCATGTNNDLLRALGAATENRRSQEGNTIEQWSTQSSPPSTRQDQFPHHSIATKKTAAAAAGGRGYH
eukprot:GHVU01162704.1.p1 GENE.GHVU01162704.1~~GHVU01162704.1.p1  ORF type:complete len:126 (-),score=22.34 GHVU01162704.1:605-982(-)